MAVAVLVATITAPFNQGARGLFNALVTFLAAHPGISIIDATYQRLESQEPGDNQRISIAYETGLAISAGWQARFYTQTASATAPGAFNNDLGAGATFVPWFVIDVTHHIPNRSSGDTFIVLGCNTVTDPFGFNRKNVYIAQPAANILAGAAGTCTLFDGSGTNLGTATVTNVGTSTWLQFQRNYALMDFTTGLLIAVATCDPGAATWTPPASTTTTAFPSPSMYPQTQPTTPAPAPA